MAGRETPVRDQLRTERTVKRRAIGPRSPARSEPCPGAAAQLAAVHRVLRNGPVLQLEAVGGAPAASASRPTRANRTGLPDRLKSGVEALSGIALDEVKVHYNSSKPAELGALAYAQGSDIHLAPGQERHLPHEAWHVVQQKQGRVKPTLQMKGVAINDDLGLEREADAMGAKATAVIQPASSPSRSHPAKATAVQRKSGGPGGLAERLLGGSRRSADLLESGTADSITQLKDLADVVIRKEMIGYFETSGDFVWLAGGESQGKDLSHVHLFAVSKDNIKGQLTVRKSLEKGGPEFEDKTINKEDVTAEVIKKFGSDQAGQENRIKIADGLKELIDAVIDEWKAME